MTADSRGPWVTTFSKRTYHFLDPLPEEVDLVDIAHSLGQTCRFNGHCPDHYSVAQHSVLVSRAAGHLAFREGLPRKHYQQWGLLHDAGEAYVGDMVCPLKRLLRKEGDLTYDACEAKAMETIAKRFELPNLYKPGLIKEADRLLIAAEARDLMGLDWSHLADPRGIVVGKPLSAQDAKQMFLWEAAALELS